MRVVTVLALWSHAFTSAAQSQATQAQGQPRAASGVISGVVTDGHTKTPVAGALVQLLTMQPAGGGVPLGRPRLMTDGRGRFVFQGLAAGSYGILVNAPGYLEGGRSEPGSSIKRITLEDRQLGEANAVLWKPASISGTIRDETGEPLVDVPVRIFLAFKIAGRDQWAAGVVTQTDDRGAYRFAGLLPGRYVVHVPGIQVTLADGEVALYRPPVRPTTGGAQPPPRPAPPPVIRAADGVGTMAGHFAAPPPGSGQVYPATFHPAARSLLTADVLEVHFGTQRGAVDVSLIPVPAVRVSGTVIGSPAAIANMPVRLMATGNERLGFGGETALTKTDPAGRFVLAQVPQGDYTVIVGRAVNEFLIRSPTGGRPDPGPSAANPFLGRFSGAAVGGEPGLFVNAIGMSGADASGTVSLSVGSQAIEGLTVPTTAGVTVSGHALYDGSETPAPGRTRGPFGPNIRIDPADGDISRTVNLSVNPNRPAGPTFSIANVIPGRYRLHAGENGGYRLVGATWNGRDLFATPLEVTGDGPVTGIVVHLSTKQNAVSGVVRAADGKVATGAVLVFPQDRDRWREPGVSAVLFRNVEASPTGTFTSENLIPGDYFIAAVPFEDRRRGLEIEFLDLLAPKATRIKVDESGTVTVELRVTEVKR